MKNILNILIAGVLLVFFTISCGKIDQMSPEGDPVEDIENGNEPNVGIGVSKMEGWAGDYISIAAAQVLKGLTFTPITEGANASTECATVLRGDRLWLGLYKDDSGNPIDCEIKLTATTSEGGQISTVVKSKMWTPMLVKYGPEEERLSPEGPLYDGDYYAVGIVNSSGRYLLLDGGRGNVWDSSISVSCDWWIDYGYHQPWDMEYEDNVWILFYVPTNQEWTDTRMIFQCGCLTRILEPEIL